MLVKFLSTRLKRFRRSKNVENRSFWAHPKLGLVCGTCITYTMAPGFKSFYAKKNKPNYGVKYLIIQMKTKHSVYVRIFVNTSRENRWCHCRASVGVVGILVPHKHRVPGSIPEGSIFYFFCFIFIRKLTYIKFHTLLKARVWPEGAILVPLTACGFLN